MEVASGIDTGRGALYVIPTPIGHLGDVTLRALETLRSVDVVLCEDTRHSRRLLRHYEIDARTESFHMHNEATKTRGVIRRMLADHLRFGLVSDAGMPGISDAGFSLVRACWANQIQVECLPGATACMTALVASGFPSDRFVFEGFLPKKKHRKARLEALKHEARTMILYESPHRLRQTITDLADTFGSAHTAALMSEMTKKHARTKRGTLAELLAELQTKTSIRGEYTLVIPAIGKA